ncbi:hypothetical protein NKG05_27675 [Oerskovia sp. M15]
MVVALLLVGGAGFYLVNNASSLLGFENPFSASDYDGQGVDPVDVTIAPARPARTWGRRSWTRASSRVSRPSRTPSAPTPRRARSSRATSRCSPR